jgi:hypothetical protein
MEAAASRRVAIKRKLDRAKCLICSGCKPALASPPSRSQIDAALDRMNRLQRLLNRVQTETDAWSDERGGGLALLSTVAKYWCRLRGRHHYQDDGDPIATWGPADVPAQGSYRQVRRCTHWGDAYDTFAGFVVAAENAKNWRIFLGRSDSG